MADAIDLAIRNNRDLAVLQKNVEAAEGRVKAASRRFQDNPDLSWKVAKQTSGSRGLTDYSLSLGQRIEIRGQRGLRTRIAELELSKAWLRLEKAKFSVEEDVKGLFIDLASLNERLQATTALLKVEEELLDWLTAQAVHGEIPSVESNTVQLEVLITRGKIMALNRSLMETRQDLEWVMNTQLPEGATIDASYPDFPEKIDLDVILPAIDKSNFDIRLARVDSENSVYLLRLIRAGRDFPSIKPFLSWYSEEGDNFMGLGLSMPIPLFNRRGGEISAARADSEKYALQLREVRDRVRSDMEKYDHLLSLDDKQRETFVSQILPISRESVDDARLRYQRGEIDLTTLERYSDAWAKSRVEYSKFIQDYYHTLCRVESLLGTELNDLAGNRETGE
jgi:cobalt-zinc-cadmium efflux system outer membrane protein